VTEFRGAGSIDQTSAIYKPFKLPSAFLPYPNPQPRNLGRLLGGHTDDAATANLPLFRPRDSLRDGAVFYTGGPPGENVLALGIQAWRDAF
jgi:hypothetical protein